MAGGQITQTGVQWTWDKLGIIWEIESRQSHTVYDVIYVGHLCVIYFVQWSNGECYGISVVVTEHVEVLDRTFFGGYNEGAAVVSKM